MAVSEVVGAPREPDRAPLPSLLALAPSVFAFVTGILPLFLTSTLAPELRADLDFSTARLGMAVAVFFAAAAIGSGPLGWVAEHLGAGPALRVAAATSATSMATLALFARSWSVLAAGMVIAGLAQALMEPAANLYLARTIDPRRLGFAFGIKQAAVPAATMLGGLAVPAIALPFGWRWVYAVGAIAALAAIVIAPRTDPPSRAPSRRRDGDVPMRPLLLLAAGVGLGGAAASTVAAYAVDSATDVGFSTTAAALLAGLGGLLGVVTRVTSGLRADLRVGGHLRIVRNMLAVGVVVFVLLATSLEPAFLVAIPAAYVTAWGWPGLMHLAVVRQNPGAPSAATGIVMTGAFIGSVGGPLVFGWLVEHQSYGTAWIASAASSLAAVFIVTLADRAIGHETGDD